MLLADRIAIIDSQRIQKIIKKEELIDNVEYLKSIDIATPKIIELVSKLKANKIDLELRDFNLDNLASAIKSKIVGDSSDN